MNFEELKKERENSSKEAREILVLLDKNKKNFTGEEINEMNKIGKEFSSETSSTFFKTLILVPFLYKFKRIPKLGASVFLLYSNIQRFGFKNPFIALGFLTYFYGSRMMQLVQKEQEKTKQTLAQLNTPLGKEIRKV